MADLEKVVEDIMNFLDKQYSGYVDGMGFWTKQDVLRYVIENDLEICSVYGDIKQSQCGKYYLTGEQRTGCMFCAFGAHLEPEPNRFQRMAVTHPGYYRLCFESLENGGLRMGVPLDYLGIPYETWESVGQMNFADYLNEERNGLCGK